MNPGAPKTPRVAPKRPRVGTSDHRTCCQNLTTQGKTETVLEKQSFTCFLILPDEIIGNQIDNVAITKNCQKRPWAARDPIHPWSGALQFCVNVLKHLLGVAQPRLETYHRIKLWSEDQKQMNKIRGSGRHATVQNQAVLREIPPALWSQTVDSRLLTTYFWFCGYEWKWSPNQQPLFVMLQKHVNQYSERSKPINFCSWPPLWPLVFVLNKYIYIYIIIYIFTNIYIYIHIIYIQLILYYALL